MALQTEIYIYTSSKAPKPREAKYYYKITCKGQLRQGVGRMPEGTTQNQLALLAIIAAFQRLIRPAMVTVHTDCSYLATYHKYAERWKQNGWKTSTGAQAKNEKLWAQLLELEAMHTVKYQLHQVMPKEEEV